MHSSMLRSTRDLIRKPTERILDDSRQASKQVRESLESPGVRWSLVGIGLAVLLIGSAVYFGPDAARYLKIERM